MINMLKLTQNMCLVNDQDSETFSSWLLNIGHGCGRSDDKMIHLPQDMVSPDVETFVAEIYPTLRSSPPPPPKYFLNRIILRPQNNNIDSMNNDLLSIMSGEEQVFYSADTVA